MPTGCGYDNLRGALALLSQLNDDQIVSDVSAAIDYLKSCDDVNGKVGLTGFCTGGRICLNHLPQSPGHGRGRLFMPAPSPCRSPASAAAAELKVRAP